jgi:putative transposase
MHFETGGIYHIYNQGNNRQKIFFNRANYLFFLQKVRNYVQPYGNILAYCLMPNHFHLMVEVEKVAIPVHVSDGVTQSSPIANGFGVQSHPVTKVPALSHPVTNKLRTLNDSIGIMLRSYTRAVNLQEKRTGNLFREETKAICLNEIRGITSNWYTDFGVTFMNVQIPEFQYIKVCFDYIHNNPVKARLAENPEDWEFSSYADLKGLRNGGLVNKERAFDLGLSFQIESAGF